MTRPDHQTSDDFDLLLAWLCPDPESAGTEYEAIRQGLIKIFEWRGCGDPEGLADETIIRVTAKVREVAPTYKGDPAHYFYGVANNVFMECWRDRTVPLSDRADTLLAAPEPEDRGEDERRHECLDRCLARLPAPDRDLILCYYRGGEGQHKIDYRKDLAEKTGVSVGSLRVRVHRLRRKLEKCIQRCLDEAPDEMD